MWSGKNYRRSRRISRGGPLHRKGERNSRVVPPFLESLRCLSPFRDTCFPCTASTFKTRIDSHHGGTWDRPVGKPRGKSSWESLEGKPRGKDSRESNRSLDTREGKPDSAATAREESARACPHSRRGVTPLGRLQQYPEIHVGTGEETSGSGTDSTQGFRPRHRRRGIPRGPQATRKGTGLS